MKAKDIIDLMDNLAPKYLIEPWDNTGFQIGDYNKDVSKILLALDLSEEVYKKAIEENFHMIITHHPFIFKPISSITTMNYKENQIYNLIKNDIVIYNAHTNLDQAYGGVNHELGRLLQLSGATPLKLNNLPLEDEYGFGMIGDIDEVDLVDFISVIKEILDIDYLKVYGNQNRRVKRVALCGGSGSDFIPDAYEKGACIYITGDIKYHDAQLGAELGLTLIDAGHFHTEKVVLPVVKKYLEKECHIKPYIEIWDEPSPKYKVY